METQKTQNSHADLLNKRQVSGFQVPSFKTYYNSNEDRIPLGRSRMCRFRILDKGVGQGQAGTLSLPFFLSRVWPDGHVDGVWQMQTGILHAGLLMNTEGMPVAHTGLREVITLCCVFLPLRLCGFQWAFCLCGLHWVLFRLSHGGQNVTQTSCELNELSYSESLLLLVWGTMKKTHLIYVFIYLVCGTMFVCVGDNAHACEMPMYVKASGQPWLSSLRNFPHCSFQPWSLAGLKFIHVVDRLDTEPQKCPHPLVLATDWAIFPAAAWT